MESYLLPGGMNKLFTTKSINKWIITVFNVKRKCAYIITRLISCVVSKLLYVSKLAPSLEVLAVEVPG